MMFMYLKHSYLVLICIFIVSLLYACAGTQGTHSVLKELDEHIVLKNYNTLNLIVQGSSNVSITDEVKNRITNLIIDKLKADEYNHFREFNTANIGSVNAIDVEVIINNYEKGNAFARAMLAGLGQIHIDANVMIKNSVTKELLTEHEVSKAFAWGGIYGGATTIEDVEEGFAKGVAAVILEKADE
ncbi:MAG: DUF4410 domain-containing protein [Candidatus Magnetoovum sp. WYHC-5]|nr:DUF4410 domain-containing protein [Candidatus Magnetoovum sp. WYHC-5]